MTPDRPIFFFMHVMKTAGTSFAQHIPANFAPGEIYPTAELGPRHKDQYWRISELDELTPEERRRIRIYHGHFPFVVGELVGADHTLTILREPVARTISALRHLERQFPRHRGKPLEDIYEDDWHHPTLLRNYQVKQFALTVADEPKAHIDVVDLDDDRFDVAVRNLEQVTVLGLTEAYEEFTAEAERRFGWRTQGAKRLQVGGDGAPISAALRARIVEDNAMDLAFYDAARVLYEKRLHAS